MINHHKNNNKIYNKMLYLHNKIKNKNNKNNHHKINFNNQILQYFNNLINLLITNQ